MSEMIFKGDGSTFIAKREAEQWLRDNGYSFGPSCIAGPQAVFKGDCYVSKWHNLNQKERLSADGSLHAGREGDATLRLTA
jgi:hypothetical protein